MLGLQTSRGSICYLTSSCQVLARLQHHRRLQGPLLCTACNAFCTCCLQASCFCTACTDCSSAASALFSPLLQRPALLSFALPRNGNQHSPQSFHAGPPGPARHCTARLGGGEDGAIGRGAPRSPPDLIWTSACEQVRQSTACIAPSNRHRATPQAVPCPNPPSTQGGANPRTAQRSPDPPRPPSTGWHAAPRTPSRARLG